MRFLLKQLGDPKPDGRPPEPDKAGGEAAPGPGTGTGEQADSPAGGPAGHRGPIRRAGPARRGPAEGGTAEPPPTAPPPVAFTWTEYRAFETLTPFLRHNPRRLKRLVNVYRLVRTLAAREGSAGFRNPLATIRWLALADQWPYAASAMLRRFERLLDEWEADPVERARRRPADTSWPRLSQRAPSKKKRLALDDDAELGRAARMPSRPVVVEQLVAMRRYTVNFNPAIEEEMRAGLEQPEARARRTARSPGRPCRPRVDSPPCASPPSPRDRGGGLVGYRRHPPEARHRRRHARDDPRLPVRGRLCARARLARRHGRSRRDGGRDRAALGHDPRPRPLPDRGLHPLRHERRERGHGLGPDLGRDRDLGVVSRNRRPALQPVPRRGAAVEPPRGRAPRRDRRGARARSRGTAATPSSAVWTNSTASASAASSLDFRTTSTSGPVSRKCG